MSTILCQLGISRSQSALGKPTPLCILLSLEQVVYSLIRHIHLRETVKFFTKVEGVLTAKKMSSSTLVVAFLLIACVSAVRVKDIQGTLVIYS